MPERTLDSLVVGPRPNTTPELSAVTTRAEFFVRMVQGTMALEGQAVGTPDAERLVKQATAQLLADPRQVWDER